MPVVGVLRVNAEDTELFAGPFRGFMKEFGWEEGRNIRFEYLWAGGQYDRLPAMARDLVERKVDVLVTFGNPAVQATQRATKTIPIIGLTDDLVGYGLAVSMARPGGNTTGVSILGTELDTKRHELLHEFVPGAKRIAILADPDQFKSRGQIEAATRAYGIELSVFTVRNPEEISRALDAMEAAHVEAVNVLASPVLNASGVFVIERLRLMRLPSILSGRNVRRTEVFSVMVREFYRFTDRSPV